MIRLETQYWALVEIPRQEKQETVPAFVLRACSIMEKTQKSGEGVKTSAKIAEEEDRRRERLNRLEGESLNIEGRVPFIIISLGSCRSPPCPPPLPFLLLFRPSLPTNLFWFLNRSVFLPNKFFVCTSNFTDSFLIWLCYVDLREFQFILFAFYFVSGSFLFRVIRNKLKFDWLDFNGFIEMLMVQIAFLLNYYKN